MKVFKASVLSVLLYGAETWNVMRADVRMLEVFYLRCLRRILGVSAFHDRIRNEEVLKRARMPDVESMLRQRRWRWFGHVLRMGEERVPKKLVCGRVRGRMLVGRPAKRWSDWIREEAPSVCPKLDFLAKARDKPRWRTSCFNVALFASSS